MNELHDIKKLILQYLGHKKKHSQRSGEFTLFEYNENSLSLRKTTNLSRLSRDSFILSCLPRQSVLLSCKDASNFSFKSVFDSIKDQYHSTGLIRIDGNKNESEIHISIIIQFWLSCFVAFQVFLNMLLAPIRQKDWVQYEDFIKSLDALHQKVVCRAFFSSKQDKKFSSTLRMQKLLCILYLVYFSVVEYEIKEINLNGLAKVIEFAQRMPKSKEKELKALAEGFIHKANQQRGFSKLTISSKEFYKILISTLAL